MPTPLPQPNDYFVGKLHALHLRMRGGILDAMKRSSTAALSAVAAARDGDTIYAIDEKGEDALIEFCEEWAREAPFVLIAEGLPGSGQRVFPASADVADAAFRLIIDPIDGTRGLMYDKRSAWILSAIAPNLGDGTTLADVQVAMQTEIPTTRQYLADVLWAVKGQGVRGERHNVLDGSIEPFTPQPSAAASIAHGFATVSKFFPGAKRVLVEIEERLVEAAVGKPVDGNPLAFDDEYISSGGQFYELMAGHDRFVADLRPLAHAVSPDVGEAGRLCAHPYDVCTELIAREAGVIITDDRGQPLSSKLDIREDVAWVGYANEAIREQIEPTLMGLLDEIRARSHMSRNQSMRRRRRG